MGGIFKGHKFGGQVFLLPLSRPFANWAHKFAKGNTQDTLNSWKWCIFVEDFICQCIQNTICWPLTYFYRAKGNAMYLQCFVLLFFLNYKGTGTLWLQQNLCQEWQWQCCGFFSFETKSLLLRHLNSLFSNWSLSASPPQISASILCHCQLPPYSRV